MSIIWNIYCLNQYNLQLSYIVLVVSGVMALGKLPVPRCPTIWMIVGQGPTALAVGEDGGCLGIFTLLYLFSPLLPLSGRRPDIDWNTVSKGCYFQNNQPTKSSAGASYNLMIVGQGLTALAVGAAKGVVWTFLLSSILSLLCLPFFGRWVVIDWNTVSKGR